MRAERNQQALYWYDNTGRTSDRTAQQDHPFYNVRLLFNGICSNTRTSGNSPAWYPQRKMSSGWALPFHFQNTTSLVAVPTVNVVQEQLLVLPFFSSSDNWLPSTRRWFCCWGSALGINPSSTKSAFITLSAYNRTAHQYTASVRLPFIPYTRPYHLWANRACAGS